MSLKFKENGLTLVELIISILLLNVVILTGLSMEMGMRKLFTGADYTSDLEAEAASTMTFVTKKINKAIGAQALGGGYLPYQLIGAGRWSLLQDTNTNGIPEPGTDVRCAFRYFDSGANKGQVCYYDDVANINGAPTMILATHCIGFDISDPAAPDPDDPYGPYSGYSTVKIQLIRDISNVVPNATNPTVFSATNAQYLEASFS
jgi:hypothetical protein